MRGGVGEEGWARRVRVGCGGWSSVGALGDLFPRGRLWLIGVVGGGRGAPARGGPPGAEGEASRRPGCCGGTAVVLEASGGETPCGALAADSHPVFGDGPRAPPTSLEACGRPLRHRPFVASLSMPAAPTFALLAPARLSDLPSVWSPSADPRTGVLVRLAFLGPLRPRSVPAAASLPPPVRRRRCVWSRGGLLPPPHPPAACPSLPALLSSPERESGPG